MTNSEALRRAISHLIEVAHSLNKKVGICGQAPSDDPEFLRFLVREGIDSISLNFDTYASGRVSVWRTEIIEEKLQSDQKVQAYNFLEYCDKLIETIRIPKGKLNNMVRKQKKNVNPKLHDISNQFNQTFIEVSKISRDFIDTINQENVDDFPTSYKDYDLRIKRLGEQLPELTNKLREFGIF